MKGIIIIDGKAYDVFDFDEVEYLEEGKAYSFEDGNIYAYYGKLQDGKDNPPGLYLDDNDDIVLLEYLEGSEITLDKVMDRKQYEEFMDKIHKLKDASVMAEIQRKKEDTLPTNQRKRNPLHFEISPNDDDVVRLLKQAINSKNITLQDVCKAIGNDSRGINLVNSIRKTKGGITYKTLLAWCKVLNMRAEFKLVDMDSKEGK